MAETNPSTAIRDPRTHRQLLDRRFEDIWRERETFVSRWRDLGNFILPTRPRFIASDANRGTRTYTKVRNSTATQALGIAKSGLLAGMASPARPWFAITTSDRTLAEKPEIRVRPEAFRDAILSVFDRSNWYNSLGQLFEDELVFATGAMAILDDPRKIIRTQTFPIGSYAIAQNDKGVVDSFVREVTMTVRQVVERWGKERVTQATWNAFQSEEWERPIAVRHAIWANRKADKSLLGAASFPWAEFYWEKDGSGGLGEDKPTWGGSVVGPGGTEGGTLEEGGYHEFPVVVARWAKNDDDVYGTSCPAMVSIGDIKQLQEMERTGANGLALMVHPSLLVPPALKNKPVSLLPGAKTYDAEAAAGPGRGTRPTHEVRLPLGELRQDKAEIENRIKKAFHVDLFQMLIDDARGTPPTATEINERVREKMQVLGPILERHSDDVFDPAIERVAAMMIRRSEPDWALGQDGLLPMPPEDLAGANIRPLYVSEVAQAQRLVGLNGLERHLQFVGGMAEIMPQALDMVDPDVVVKEHAETLGIDPEITRMDEAVAEIRAVRAQQDAAAQMAQAAPGVAGAVKDLSEAQVGEQSVLEQMSGVGAA
jgi:hypothetical protein